MAGAESAGPEGPDDPQPVLVVTTGGTIDKVYFDARSDYEVGESVVDYILRQARVRAPWVLLPVLRKDLERNEFVRGRNDLRR